MAAVSPTGKLLRSGIDLVQAQARYDTAPELLATTDDEKRAVMDRLCTDLKQALSAWFADVREAIEGNTDQLAGLQ